MVWIVQLYYISVVTEILNIIRSTLILNLKEIPFYFEKILGMSDILYSIYVIIALFSRYEERISMSFKLITITILKEILWKHDINMIMLDSLVCIAVMIYHNEKLLKKLDQTE